MLQLPPNFGDPWIRPYGMTHRNQILRDKLGEDNVYRIDRSVSLAEMFVTRQLMRGQFTLANLVYINLAEVQFIFSSHL